MSKEKENKDKTIIWILSVVIVFLIVGFIIFINSSKEGIPQEDNLNDNINNIFPRDEPYKENTENDKQKLEDVAKKFGRAMERRNFGQLYDLLTPIDKTLKTKEEFVTLFPLIWTNEYLSFIFNKLDISEDRGYAYYDITDRYGFKYTSSAYRFIKENGE